MNALLNRLGMSPISPLFDQCYEAVREETGIPEWLTEGFLLETLGEFPFLGENRQLVLSALPEIRKDPDLVLFARVLHRMLGLRKHQKEVFGGLKFPKSFGLGPLYPLLARSREAYRMLRHRGVEEEILRTTAARMDGSLSDSIRLAGRPALSLHYFLWLTVHSNGTLFVIGRFEMELRENCRQNVRAFHSRAGDTVLLAVDGLRVHRDGLILDSAGAEDARESFETSYRETSECFEGHPVRNGRIQRELCRLSKQEWRCLYAPGDSLISVHIPKEGDFRPETVEASLEQAWTLLRIRFPEKDFRGFLCMSWLLDPKLGAVLKPSSNILSFGNRFLRYPTASKGRDVFRFVFQREISGDVDWDSLPQNTSLARNLAQYYRAGNFIHETGGLLFLRSN